MHLRQVAGAGAQLGFERAAADHQQFDRAARQAPPLDVADRVDQLVDALELHQPADIGEHGRVGHQAQLAPQRGVVFAGNLFAQRDLLADVDRVVHDEGALAGIAGGDQPLDPGRGIGEIAVGTAGQRILQRVDPGEEAPVRRVAVAEAALRMVAEAPVQHRDAAQRGEEGERDVGDEFGLGAQHHRVVAAEQDLAQHRLVDRGRRADAELPVVDPAGGKGERALRRRHPDPRRRRAVEHGVVGVAVARQALVKAHPVMRNVAVMDDRDLGHPHPSHGGSEATKPGRRTRRSRTMCSAAHSALPAAMPHIAPA